MIYHYFSLYFFVFFYFSLSNCVAFIYFNVLNNYIRLYFPKSLKILATSKWIYAFEFFFSCACHSKCIHLKSSVGYPHMRGLVKICNIIKASRATLISHNCVLSSLDWNLAHVKLDISNYRDQFIGVPKMVSRLDSYLFSPRSDWWVGLTFLELIISNFSVNVKHNRWDCASYAFIFHINWLFIFDLVVTGT